MNYIIPLILLSVSNVFMFMAWYGHLKYLSSQSLFAVILISWGIALFEYMIVTPANRYGYKVYSIVELRVIQEVISLIIFSIMITTVFGEKLTINQYMGLATISFGAIMVFKG